jgi:uncharacterized membrane protein required for colicin V production
LEGGAAKLNLVTLFAVLILAGSIFAGLRRGFVREVGAIVYQLGGIATAIFSVWVSWLFTNDLTRMIANIHLSQFPSAIRQLLIAWHNNPTIGTWICFLICFMLLSSIVHRLIRIIVGLLLSLIPRFLATSNTLGALLGGIAGVIRVVLYGGILFLILQFFSLPAVARSASSSTLYKSLTQQVYQPFLKPLVRKGLPVLEANAFSSVAHSISLFAVPSGTKGQEQGVLIVPSDVSSLAQQITAHANTPDEKARALYEWEIHHITYDWKKYNDYVEYGKWDEQSPEQTLKTQKGVCADYALLYADMAHACGLTVKIVEGTGGTGGQIGSHAWNEIWIPKERQYINVDTTWGSEQDSWFDVPDNQFLKSHFPQTTIFVKGASV